MNYTDYYYAPTGDAYYAKAEPLNAGTWSSGVVSYVENGTTGSYAATLDSTTAYAVYQRLSASPASSDTLTAFVSTKYVDASYVDYIYMPTGGNYYAKAEPLNTAEWSTGIVSYTENGTTGSYAATIDSQTAYSVYQRIGLSPASTDVQVAFITPRSSPINASLVVSGSTLSLISGVDFAFSSIVNTSGWSRVYFTIKRNRSDFDAASVVQIVKSNPSSVDDGLKTLNGSAAQDASLGSVAVSSSVSVALSDNATRLIAPKDRGYFYDIKVFSGNNVSAMVAGRVDVSSGVTLTI